MTVVTRLVLILGDQLDLQSSVLRDFDRKTDEIIMVESSNEAQYVWTHKAKIALFLSAMRHFAQKLRELKYPLIYIQESSLPMIDVLRQKMLSKKVTHLVCIEPGEWRIRQSIEALAVADIIEKTINDIYNVNFEFVQMNDVMKIVKEFSLKIRNQTYDNQCTMELEFRKTLTNQVIGKFEKIDGIAVEYLMTD